MGSFSNAGFVPCSPFSLAQAFYAWGWNAIICVPRFPIFLPQKGQKKGETGNANDGLPSPGVERLG